MLTIPFGVLAAGRRASSPCYVYDLAVIRERLRLLDALPVSRKRIHFATMANDHPLVLAEIAASGHGVFVNSIRHLNRVLDAGFPPRRIVFASSNMSLDEMATCVSADVHIVLDSVGQLTQLNSIVDTRIDVGLRVNVGSAVDQVRLGVEQDYRFGILRGEIDAALDAARRLRIIGIHSYFGTGILNSAVLIEGLKRLAEIAPAFPDLSYLDAGGGFGVPDEAGQAEFDIEQYGREAAAVIAQASGRASRPIELLLEPGRWLAAPSGWFFARIVDIKPRADRIFAGSNACVSQFPRPLVYPGTARHPCEIADAIDRPPAAKPVWISGNSTYSRDFLARGEMLADPRIGDLLVFHNAGAYCRSMLTSFLGKEPPEEIVLDSSSHRVEASLVSAATDN
jgi:diaminopimelate decarboxylase